MLIHDLRQIGNHLLEYRKDRGMTQAELAEKAGLADRTYADIERGTVNMRLSTLLGICEALNIRPNDILLYDDELFPIDRDEIIERLKGSPRSSQEAATRILKIFLDETGG